MTEREWCDLFDSHKDSLLELVVCYHPAGFVRRQSDNITAQAAELKRRQFAEEIRQEVLTDPVIDFKQADKMRNADSLLILLSETWAGVPETTDWPDGFAVLCDLLSSDFAVYGSPDDN